MKLTNMNTNEHFSKKPAFGFKLDLPLYLPGKPVFTDSETPTHSRGRAGGMWIETLALGA